MRFTTPLILALLSLPLLTACEGQNARDILGLDRRAPDEFRVVSRPPLSTPKNLTLRPPVAGEDLINLPPADIQARSLVVEERDVSNINYDYRRKMGEAETAVGVVDSYELGSQAEESFLKNAGTAKADLTIRQRLYQESQISASAQESRWLFSPKKDENRVIVDAEGEKARLEANEAAGLPPTEGETPMIEPSTGNVLEEWFQ